MKTYLNDHSKNSNNVCTNFEIFKKEIQRIFDVFNEKQTTEKVVQYLRQETSTIEYAARFQEKTNLTK